MYVVLQTLVGVIDGLGVGGGPRRGAVVAVGLMVLVGCGARTDLGWVHDDQPTQGADAGDGSTPTTTCIAETLANDAVDYGRLAVDGDAVFWDTQDGRLVRHDATGNTQLATIGFTSMVVDDANVYGTTLDAVVAVPRAGGSPVTLVADRALSLVLRDDTLFYVAEDAKAIVAYGPLHGQAVRTVVVVSSEDPYELAVDAENVYFESDTSAPYRGDVWRVGRSAQSQPVLLTTTHELTSIDVSGGALYYADGTDEVTSGVMAVTNPGVTRVVVPTANVDTLDLVADGTFGYFAVADAVPKPGYHGRIDRFALDGSSTTQVIDVGADTLVANVRTSADAIYFTTLAGVEETIGTVRKICK